MRKDGWTEQEEKLLILLRKKSVPFKKLPEYFPGRSQDSIRNRAWIIRERTTSNWIDEETIGIFDIESTNLKANVGFCLSWRMLVVSPDGSERMMGSTIKRREILNGSVDRRVISEFLKAIRDVDVLIGYYSTGFDIPFLRTRAEIHGLDFPGYGQVKHVDLFYMVRSKLKLHRSSLKAAVEALGLDAGEKGHVPLATWNKARIGNQKAIDQIALYGEQDVRITAELFKRMKKYRKLTRKSI